MEITSDRLLGFGAGLSIHVYWNIPLADLQNREHQHDGTPNRRIERGSCAPSLVADFLDDRRSGEVFVYACEDDRALCLISIGFQVPTCCCYASEP